MSTRQLCRSAFLRFLALTLALLAACSSDDTATPSPAPTGSPAVTVSPTSTETATPTETVSPTTSPPSGYPKDKRTGVPVIEAVLDAIEREDLDALAALVEFAEAPCIETDPDGHSGPLCRDGEAAGTVVQYFVASTCAPFAYYRPDEAKQIRRKLRGFLEPARLLYAAYEMPPAGSRLPSRVGRWGLLFTFETETGARLGVRLYLGERGVMHAVGDCSEGPRSIYEREALAPGARVIVAPPGDVAPTPTATEIPIATPTPVTTPTSVVPPDADATHPAGTRTGIEPIDSIIAAVEAKDGDALAALIEYIRVPCTSQPSPGYDDRSCPPGEPDGTIVERFWSGSCDAGIGPADHAKDSLREFAGATNALYLVSRARGAWEYPVRYWIEFSSLEKPDPQTHSLLVGERGVMGMTYTHCGDPPRGTVWGVRTEDWILRPAGVLPVISHGANMRSGDAHADAVIDEVLTGDWPALAQRAAFRSRTCRAPQPDETVSWPCRPGTPADSKVTAFSVYRCGEADYFTPREFESGMNALLGDASGVYAVWQRDPEAAEKNRVTQIVFAPGTPGTPRSGVLLVLRGARLVELYRGCEEAWQYTWSLAARGYLVAPP